MPWESAHLPLLKVIVRAASRRRDGKDCFILRLAHLRHVVRLDGFSGERSAARCIQPAVLCGEAQGKHSGSQGEENPPDSVQALGECPFEQAGLDRLGWQSGNDLSKSSGFHGEAITDLVLHLVDEGGLADDNAKRLADGAEEGVQACGHALELGNVGR